MTEEQIDKALDFIVKHCGKLKARQQNLTVWNIRQGRFYGVARPMARSVYFPLVSPNGKTFDVIDASGYYQTASNDRIGYKGESND